MQQENVNSSVFAFDTSHLQSNVVNADDTRANLRPEDLMLVEQTISSVLTEVAADCPGWEVLYEKPNYHAKWKPSNLVIVSKVESVLPYSLYDIFNVIINQKTKNEVFSDRAVNEVIEVFSDHTWVEYSMSRPPWPASPRELIAISHWRMLEDGTVMIIGVSAPDHYHLRPVDPQHIRAHIHFVSFVLQPTPTGTLVKRVAHLDMRGTLLSMLFKAACKSQCEMVHCVSDYLEKQKKKGVPLKPVNHVTNYAELHASYVALNGKRE